MLYYFNMYKIASLSLMQISIPTINLSWERGIDAAFETAWSWFLPIISKNWSWIILLFSAELLCQLEFLLQWMSSPSNCLVWRLCVTVPDYVIALSLQTPHLRCPMRATAAIPILQTLENDNCSTVSACCRLTYINSEPAIQPAVNAIRIAEKQMQSIF